MRVHWILAIQSNKQAPEMIRTLIKPKDHAWIVPIPNHKSWCREELSKACPELNQQMFAAQSVEEVLSCFLQKPEWPINPPIITGSLFLIGNLLSREIITTKNLY